MPDLPTFDDATDAVANVADSVREHSRTLAPWLPDPPRCEQCDAMLYASVTFDPRMVEYTTSWECRNCDAPDRYRDDPGVPDPDPPRRGAPTLREEFR